MPKVLIAGINGQLGKALLNSFKNEFIIFGFGRTEQNMENYFQCDITDVEKLQAVFYEVKPDIVINAAAMVHCDNVEKGREFAHKVNVVGNRNLLNLSKGVNAKFVFISSYYVFDGVKENYYEDDELNSVNYYGELKIVAEKETAEYNNSLIIRPGKIFSLGYDSRNFIARLDNALKKGEEQFIIDDQYNNPIHADKLSDAIKELVRAGKKGVYHVAGKDYLSNYELALAFANHFGLDINLIKTIHTKDTKQFAKRPMNVKLLTKKIEREGIKIYSLKEMFEDGYDGR